jgi:hypothetical protein
MMKDYEADYPQIWDEEARDEIEFRRFMRKVIAEMLPRAKRDMAAMENSRLPVSELLRILNEAWDVMEVIWRAASPRQKRAHEDRLVPLWREIRPLLKRTHEMAKAELERRGTMQ